MDKISKVLSAIGVGVLLVGATALATDKLNANSTQEKIDALVLENARLSSIEPQVVEKTVYVDKPVEVIKEIQVPVTQIQEVDNGNLDMVMSFVEDNFDEDITVDYILFETDAKIQSEAFIRSNLISLLDDADFFDDGALLDNFRKSEVSLTKIYEAEVFDRDYDNKDLTLQYEVKVKAKESGEDSISHIFEVTLPFEDGKLVEDDVELTLVE